MNVELEHHRVNRKHAEEADEKFRSAGMGVPAVHLSPPALAALHLMYGHESEKLEQMISAHSRAKMMADQEREGQRVKMMQGQKQDQERSRLIEESETTGSDGTNASRADGARDEEASES